MRMISSCHLRMSFLDPWQTTLPSTCLLRMVSIWFSLITFTEYLLQVDVMISVRMPLLWTLRVKLSLNKTSWLFSLSLETLLESIKTRESLVKLQLQHLHQHQPATNLRLRNPGSRLRLHNSFQTTTSTTNNNQMRTLNPTTTTMFKTKTFFSSETIKRVKTILQLLHQQHHSLSSNQQLHGRQQQQQPEEQQHDELLQGLQNLLRKETLKSSGLSMG